jgi:hypothetical protein
MRWYATSSVSPVRATDEEGDVVSATLSDDERPHVQQVPATLAEAHDVLWRQQPARGADLREWVAFHRYSAAVYSETAKVDQRHHHEATQ